MRYRYILILLIVYNTQLYAQSYENPTSDTKNLQFYQNAIAAQKSKDTIMNLGKEAVNTLGSRSAIFVSIGNAYANIKENILAVDAFRQAIHLNPKSSSIHNRLGLALLVIGFYRQSESAYKAAIAFASTDSMKILYYMNLIKVLEKLDEPEEIQKILSKILKIDPSYQAAITLKNSLNS